MGNSCNAQSLLPQKQLKLSEKQVQLPKIPTQSSAPSSFLPRMNAMLANNDEEIQNQYPKTTTELIYVEPKVLEEEISLTSDNKFIFSAIMRTQFKGKIFFHQNDIRSDLSIMNTKENVQEVTKQLTDDNIKEIYTILQKHFLFIQLNQTQKIETIKQMKIYSSKRESYIFKEGDDAEKFFIISEGEVEVIIQGEAKKQLKKGQSFGEIALLFDSKRTASVKTMTNCLFWSIDRLTFKRIVEDINLKAEQQNRQFLEKTDFFKYLTPIQQQSVMNVIVTFKYQPNQSIINDGQQFYIIKSGQVVIEKQNGEQIVLQKGNQFGDKSFQILQSRKPLDVKAQTDCVIICITKDQIIQTLGSTIENVMIINRIRRAMEKSKRFRVILHKSMEQFSKDFNIKKVTAGEKILKKGHIMKNFYIPLDVQLGSVQKTYPLQEIIEQNLLIEGHPLLHGITAKTDGSILIMKASADIFTEVISFKSQINANNIKLDNIQIIRKIGSGQFGEVYAGLHLISNELVAVKVVSKKTVQKYSIQKQIVNEQNVMKNMNHPFIVKYFNTFIAKRQIFFILEYIPGKELFDVIREIGLLKSHEAQFFSAQILLALQYMHNLEIIYRDLKPENIMVDTTGYLKLIDMGTAKLLKKDHFYKTRTVIGTPHYMSPETISGKGYSFKSDLWSFGILLFELVCGYLPYQNKNNDPFEIYKQIMNKNLEFPGYLKDYNTKQIIMKLLNKNSQSRMSRGYNDLKKMAFFKGFDWIALEKKTLPSVYEMQESIGVDLTKVDREGLCTIPQYFQKQVIKQGGSHSKKQISWQANLLDNN